MKYIGQHDFSHAQQPKIGVLITNLGTPDAPETKALRKYLAEFLSDPRVVEFPRFLWKIILHGIILRIRPRRSAAAYREVWQDDGSPLMIHTKNQCTALRESLRKAFDSDIEVEFAMRYGSPSITDTIGAMQKQGVRQLLVLPLYPQYSGATTASTFDAIAHDFTKRRWLPDLRFISHYHDNVDYIDAVANSIQQFRQEHGSAEKLVFSYHGVPLRYLKNGDPYHCECYKTTRLIAEKLNLNKDDYLTTFQSRFGREEWLKPYTDETLKSLAAEGVKSVQVICPGFSADCLETIEEIGMENRDYFLEGGGEKYQYIPALNDSPEHIEALTKLVIENLSGWKTPEKNAGAKSQEHFELQKDKCITEY
jgi:ferrochelatase